MSAVLERIDRMVDELAAIRAVIANGANGVNNTNIVDGRYVVKQRYTAAEAETEKANIEAAFERGELSFDKKRGAKMLVTNRTAAKTDKKVIKYKLKPQYSPRSATNEIAAIEMAFQNGAITYDEKRGLKRSVTVRIQS